MMGVVAHNVVLQVEVSALVFEFDVAVDEIVGLARDVMEFDFGNQLVLVEG